MSTSFNDVDAVEIPESQTDPPTEAAAVVKHHGRSSISVSVTSVLQPTPVVDEHDTLPSVVGPRQNSPCINRRDSSTSSDPFGEHEQTLRWASKGWPALSSGGGENRKLQLPSPDSIEDCRLSVIRARSRSSSKRSPETLTIFGTPTLSPLHGAGGLPAQDRSVASVVGSMTGFQRLCSDPDTGSGLHAVGVGRPASRNVAEKKGKSANIILCADRMRRASWAAVPHSAHHLAPDTDCSELLVTGVELMKG